ncbi:hypothetical protein [Gracilinema caldarium]|uniref:hypothetical protein n=1 Tax=Gracilinema caldarium TaxID=215591 RepID=UPI0026ECCC3C|nr:hypothetical protein [Gracilinema caldarium]
MNINEILDLASESSLSSETHVQLAFVLEGFNNADELSRSLPPALQFVGPRPWINTIKVLYSKGTEQGGNN